MPARPPDGILAVWKLHGEEFVQKWSWFTSASIIQRQPRHSPPNTTEKLSYLGEVPDRAEGVILPPQRTRPDDT